MTISFQFKEISQAQLQGMVDLFKECFGDTKLTSDYVKWLYFDNPDGNVIGYNAYDGENLAAHYAVVPRNFMFENSKTVLSLNTATSPEYRGMSLFGKLATRTYELAKLKSNGSVLGVANQNSINGFLKRLQFSHHGQVGLRVVLTKQLQSLSEIKITEEQLAWRLRNPAVKYFSLKLGDRKFAVFSYKRSIPICLGLVSHDLSYLSPLKRSIQVVLLPVYSMKSTNLRGVEIPNKFLPSPWHVIQRQLCETELEHKFDLFGLHMDTF